MVFTLLEERIAFLVKERLSLGLGFLGKEKVLNQVPGSLPHEVSRNTRPPVYTSDAALRREAREEIRERVGQYRIASMRFRLGELNVEFPPHSFKPPLHRKPRHERFTPLPDDYFKHAA